MRIVLTSAIVIVLAGISGSSHASGFTPGDILVSEGGLGSPFNNLFEYTPAGAMVRSVTIPTLPGQDIFDNPKGMVVDSVGNLHVFNGSSTIGISNYNPVTNVWTSTMLPEDSILPNSYFGKIATLGNNVYIPTQQPGGIIRYNFTTGVHTTYSILGQDPIDFSVGSDGLLYALEGSDLPMGGQIEVINPNSMSVVKNISLDNLQRGSNGGDISNLSVRSDGKILLSQNLDPLILIDANGNQLANYALQHSTDVQDIDLSSNGTFAEFNSNGQVYMFDKNLNFVRNFQSSPDGTSNCFGAFVPSAVPEPTTLLGLMIGFGVFVKRRKPLI